MLRPSSLAYKYAKRTDMFSRRSAYRQRSVMDHGLMNPVEAGTDAFSTGIQRSTSMDTVIRSDKAVQRELTRDAKAKEFTSTFFGAPKRRRGGAGGAEKDDDDDGRGGGGGGGGHHHARSGQAALERARDVSLFATPATEAEQRYSDAEFAREMQLEHQEQEQGDNNNYHRHRGGAEPKSSNKRRGAATRRLPHGMNLVRGPESLVRRRRTMDDDESIPYSKRIHNARIKEEVRRLNISYKTAQKPSASEYASVLQKLSASDAVDEEVEKLHDRLVEESGLYPTHRLDAYMLRDDSLFPTWVNELPPHVRDRVRFGGIGLTEDDEVLRQNLARIPRDEREREWARLKSAREYKQGTAERKLTAGERRQVRLGMRRQYALHQKRLRRATLLKQLALRKPEKFETWPSRDVDYSARLAQVAQFVENGVPTMGEWPLDTRRLVTAQRKAKVAKEAEAAFVRAGVGVASGAAAARPGGGAAALQIGPGMQGALQRLDDRQRDVKRISKRQFTSRVNAIAHGDRDEHGRKYHVMKRWSREKRRQAFASVDEVRLSKEALPFVDGHESHRASPHERQGESYHPYAEERRKFGVPAKYQSD